MIPVAGVVATTFVLSITIAYAMWVRVRVWLFRQDLYAIRDDLWYELRDKGLLDDPSHRQLRESINGMIRFAPRLSVWTLLEIAKLPPQERKTHHKLPEVQAASRAVGERVAHYIVFQTASGFAFAFVMALRHGQRLLARQLACLAIESRHAMATREVRSIDWESPRPGHISMA